MGGEGQEGFLEEMALQFMVAPSAVPPVSVSQGRALLGEWNIWSSLGGSVQSPPQCGVAMTHGPSKTELLQPQVLSPGVPACVYKAPFTLGLAAYGSVMPTF